jgi:hypothetical protein
VIDDDQLARLDEATAVPLGYPMEFVSAFYPMLVAGGEAFHL